MGEAVQPGRDGGAVDVRHSSIRQRPDTSFGVLVRRGIVGSVQAAGQHAGAGYMLPGTAVVSAAISRAGALADGGVASDQTASSAAPAAAGGKMSPEQLYEAQREMQQRHQIYNMQAIALQEETQQNARHFSTCSNLLKTRHDALRNTISNLR